MIGFTARARLADERLRQLHHRRVVAVGLVRLEHRELRVVVAVDALVPEVPPELVDALHAPHEQAFEVELERDPELHLDAERLVERRERPGVGAARHGLEHRALDLEEAALVEDLADRAEHRRPRGEVAARRLVGDQMEVASPLLEIRVLEAVPLLRQRPQRLREHRPPL